MIKGNYDEDDDAFSTGSADSDFSNEAGSLDDDTQEGSKKSDELRIASTESKFVLCSKFMAYLVLFLSAAAAGIAAFYFTRRQETDDFEHDFGVYARDIARSCETSLLAKIDVAESLSISVTSFAIDSSSTFPEVTLPDYELRAQKSRDLSDSEAIVFAPFIAESQLGSWETYTTGASSWVHDSLEVVGLGDFDPGTIPPFVHDLGVRKTESVGTGNVAGLFAPFWQVSPPPLEGTVVNADLMTNTPFVNLASHVVQFRRAAISRMFDPSFVNLLALDGAESDTESGFNLQDNPPDFVPARSMIVVPIFDSFEDVSEVVGLFSVVVPWELYFRDLLPDGVEGIEIVVNDSCGSTYTFRLDGKVSSVKGVGDLHDRSYDGLRERYTFDPRTIGAPAGIDVSDSPLEVCTYTLDIYPTTHMKEKDYSTNDPIIYAVAVTLIFIFTAFVFLVYDWAVQLRQKKVLRTATRTQAIVSSLFPKNVQERIFKDVEEEVKAEEKGASRFRGNRTKDQLRNFLADGTEDVDTPDTHNPLKSKPIADLFPEATIIFADIVGFTAWSSTREPSQVFTLLENIYHSFDEIAKRRRIFKVETVGDCYVAVSGLPEPRKDHAIAMARFSKDILVKFREMVKHMVVELGPDTEDLGLRVGLHSGPVTAGVLRGERARFQLFGDTMNTTARMESTGMPNKIQMSQETADLLIAAGKSQWLRARREKVNAKGKGELQTYWLDVSDDSATKSTTSSHTGLSDTPTEEPESARPTGTPQAEQAPEQQRVVPVADKHMRLISWNTDILARLLTQIIARRESRNVVPDAPEKIKKLEEAVNKSHLVLNEVKEIVMLPKFESTGSNVDPSHIELSTEVVEQLKDYVQTLSAMYRDNPFHNFEHASHVTMSVLKLLSRIVAPADLKNNTDKTLHDHTYGITSDPMTQFAVVLSALIHDADHPGVPNSQLIKENCSIASVYHNKSIAEQNSVDLAWDLLMDDAYIDLRRAIYVTEEDFHRFRQLVINIVLATDIMDKDLGALRKGRWNKAFAESPLDESPDLAVNRKATIVMEHLIQASDVAHTMQHWHIYRKWNQRLFLEMYKAYVEGRAEKDPSENWYDGEKGFFDFYIIPLAKKLKDCGVFGVSSDEYLQYAQQNRKEWELKGKLVVAEMMQAAKDRGMVRPNPPANDMRAA